LSSFYSTSKGDKVSLPATERFYKAVGMICPPEKKASALSGGEETFETSAFDEATGADVPLDLAPFKGWKFAQLSFDTEPGLIWRWWIWK
jgi:hypothetical protein